MKYEIQEVEIRYKFTQEELNQIGPVIARLSQDWQVIARLSQDWQEKEDEKKAVMSHFKHEIDKIKQEFNENCNRLNNGFEMRVVRARMIKNYKTCEREYYSMDTFDLVKSEPFRSHDYQRDIHDNTDADTEFGRATDPTPEPNGTAETNPNQYAHLIRELNFWREQLKELAGLDDQDQEIDRGINIANKITELEITLKAMEPEHNDDSAGSSDNDDTSDSSSASEPDTSVN